MNLKQAMQRIEELERKVKELEARHPVHTHHHYHQQAPQYYGPTIPAVPQPFLPHWNDVTCNRGQFTVAHAA